MKKSVIILILNISLCSFIFSQSGFSPGYILKSEKDTVFGLLKDNTNSTNTKYCEFKKGEMDSVMKFIPVQLAGYRFINGKKYISREIQSGNEKKRLFVEYLVEGKVDLYFYQDNIGNHFLLDKDGIPMKEISRFDEFEQQDDSVFQRDAMIKRGLLEYFLSDCPQLFPEIEKLKNCSQENLIPLLRKYYKLTNTSENGISYTKVIPQSKIYLQPVFDVWNAVSVIPFSGQSVSSFDSHYQLTFGLLANFSMPLVNEKLYFRTGIIFSHAAADSLTSQSTYNMIKVPLLIQYIDDSKIISPTFGFGLDVSYSTVIPFEVLPALNVGLNVRLSKLVFVSLFTDVDVFLTQDGMQFNHSLKMSVGIKL